MGSLFFPMFNMFGATALANDQLGLATESKIAIKHQKQVLKILTKKKTTKVKKASQLISESQEQAMKNWHSLNIKGRKQSN